MRRFAFALVLIGFCCAAGALALKAVMPGPRGQVDLSSGEAVELGGGAILELKDFRVPKYPSGKPRQYESDVVIEPNGRGEAVRATISVNHPLRWNGLWIYQDSYDAANERYTVLTVFRDPWLGLATAGGVLLLMGAFLTTLSPPAPTPRTDPTSKSPKILSVLPPLLVFAAPLWIVLRAVLRAEPMPALQSPLMAPHVAAYTASYLVFILAAFGVGRRFVSVGFFLMTLGLVLGAAWGKVCWGDFWQYDPKELWSLATWLVCAAAVFCADRGRLGRVLCIVGAILCVLTATWVNFSRLFPGLHNYA